MHAVSAMVHLPWTPIHLYALLVPKLQLTAVHLALIVFRHACTSGAKPLVAKAGVQAMPLHHFIGKKRLTQQVGCLINHRQLQTKIVIVYFDTIHHGAILQLLITKHLGGRH